MIDYFGAGVLFATPLYDASGAAITVPSPIQFGIVQDITIDDSAEVKELYGADQYAVDIGRGKAKLMIKCKQAEINANLFNSVYYGQGLVRGYDAVHADTSGTSVTGAPGSTAVNIVVPGAAGSGLFIADLGVQDGNGNPYVRVASSPTSGQYSLVTGAGSSGATYQFGDQSVGNTVFISYQYSNAALPATGQVMTIQNIPMGQVPVFAAQFFNSRNGHTLWRRFPKCVATKITMDFKNDDFVIPDLEISCFADTNNVVQQFAFTE